jgi:hypothetical protein
MISPGLIDEFVPCLAAVIDDIVVGFEDAIGYPIVAHDLPDSAYCHMDVRGSLGPGVKEGARIGQCHDCVPIFQGDRLGEVERFIWSRVSHD